MFHPSLKQADHLSLSLSLSTLHFIWKTQLSCRLDATSKLTVSASLHKTSLYCYKFSIVSLSNLKKKVAQLTKCSRLGLRWNILHQCFKTVRFIYCSLIWESYVGRQQLFCIISSWNWKKSVISFEMDSLPSVPTLQRTQSPRSRGFSPL